MKDNWINMLKNVHRRLHGLKLNIFFYGIKKIISQKYVVIPLVLIYKKIKRVR